MLTAIGCLVLVVIALVVVMIFMGKSNSRLRKGFNEAKEEIEAANKRRAETNQLHNDQQEIQEKTDEAKNELEKTNDSNLINRANNLFK